MSVRMRQELERKIVMQVIDDLLSAGYAITVNDDPNGNGEDVVKLSRNRFDIVDSMFSTDGDCLLAHSPSLSIEGKPATFHRKPSGWVSFIYGNEADVIHDYTTKLEKVIAHAEAVADYYAD